MKPILLIAIFLGTLNLSSCQAVKKETTQSTDKESQAMIDRFPNAKKGYERNVLVLPKFSYDEEMERKVELFVGKKHIVDCNTYNLNGKLNPKVQLDYGYEYYVFETDGELRGTLMLCPEGKQEKRLIFSPSHTKTYDSSYPLVIYTPKGYEVHYKIWKAGTLQKL